MQDLQTRKLNIMTHVASINNEKLLAQFEQLILNKEISTDETKASHFSKAEQHRALAGLQHYKETGLHVTHEEVTEWLTSLKFGNETKPVPVCHL